MTVELEGPPEDVDVAGHDGVLAVVTRGGRPLGRLTVLAASHGVKGVLPGALLARRARTTLWHEIWVDELTERLRRRLGAPAPEELPRLSTTVAVCTRDRPQLLEGCLAALAALDPAPDRVLVVDNAPRSDCREIVASHGFDYAVEPRPGLDNARNRAIALCETELLAFTDDDCRPIPGWLACVDRRFAERATAAVTGWGSAVRLDSEAQIAFEETGGFARGFRARRFDWTSIEPTSAGVTGAGANMVFRTDVLRALGGFPPELDAGTPTASGGDIYVLGRVLAAGWRVVFDPSSMIWHDHRADVPELRRVMRGYGRGIGSMASRAAVIDRELPALSVYAWPFENLADAARGLIRRRTSLFGLLAAAEQARGAVEGPALWLKALRGASVDRRPAPPRVTPATSRGRTRPTAGSRPELSVIVPTITSRRRVLATCLAALASQTLDRDRFEVIVVPNGPLAVAGAIAGADTVLPVAAAGAAVARNAGAEVARGQQLVFLDDDILATPGCLEAHLERSRLTSGAVLGPAYPAEPFRGLAEQASARWWLDHYSRKHRPGHRFTFVDCLTGNLGLPRELFQDLGGLDVAFGSHRREDWELGCRLLLAGVAFTAAPEAVAHHHHAPTVGRMLRDARREGYGDILLSVRHPAAHRDLRLASEATPSALGGRRWRAEAALGRAITGRRGRLVEHAMAALERSRQRVRWSALLRRLLVASYLAGVQDAVEDGHRVPPLRPARTVIDIDGDGPIAIGTALGEISFLLRGEELGHVLAPDGQWDADEIAERAVDRLGLPALAVLAGSGGR